MKGDTIPDKSKYNNKDCADGERAEGCFVRDGICNTLDNSASQGKHTGPGTPAVPLRLRQLPASFWKEPNRPKMDYSSIPAVSFAYLGQSYKNFLPTYKDMVIPELSSVYNQRGVSPPSFTFTGRGDSMSDYLYRNYAAKYQSGKLPDLSWNCLRFPDSAQKLPVGPLSGITPNPYVLPAQRRTYPSTDFGYTLPSSGVPSGLWDGVTLGQYPNHALPDNLTPWRPVAAKSSSYPSRYHPFAV